MKRILESSRYVVLIAVISLLVAAIATFLLGATQTVFLVSRFVTAPSDAGLIVAIVQLMDMFLLGTVLLVFALGLHELFVQKLELPAWLVIDDLKKLKSKLSDVLILILAIKFVEKMIDTKSAQDTLMTGIGVAVVIGGLVLFNYASAKGAE
ncbi:MAG: YqhA family protein [Thermoflexales bacterium]